MLNHCTSVIWICIRNLLAIHPSRVINLIIKAVLVNCAYNIKLAHTTITTDPELVRFIYDDNRNEIERKLQPIFQKEQEEEQLARIREQAVYETERKERAKQAAEARQALQKEKNSWADQCVKKELRTHPDFDIVFDMFFDDKDSALHMLWALRDDKECFRDQYQDFNHTFKEALDTAANAAAAEYE